MTSKPLKPLNANALPRITAPSKQSEDKDQWGKEIPRKERQDDQGELVIYPEYCHEYSPTILKWCPLRVAHVHALVDVGMFVDDMRLYHFKNHPIKWVKVVGVVVAVDEFGANKNSIYGKRVFTVDDGSGACVECCCIVKAAPAADSTRVEGKIGDTKMGGEMKCANGKGKEDKEPEGVQNPKIPWKEVDVGSVIKVKGRVGAFRETKQVDVVRVEVVRGLDAEVMFWDEAGGFMRDVLGKAWVLTDEDMRRAKKRRAKLAKREREKEREEKKEKEKSCEQKVSNIEDQVESRIQHEKARHREVPTKRRLDTHPARETKKARYDAEDHNVALRILQAEALKRAAEEDTKRKRYERSVEKAKKWKHENETMNSNNSANLPSLASRRDTMGT